MDLDLVPSQTGVLLPVKVVPGSSRTRLAGLWAGALKVNLAAPPEKGKANKQLIRFLAQLLNCSRSSLTIQSGLHDTRKQIHISQITPQQLKDLLEPHL